MICGILWGLLGFAGVPVKLMQRRNSPRVLKRGERCCLHLAAAAAASEGAGDAPARGGFPGAPELQVFIGLAGHPGGRRGKWTFPSPINSFMENFKRDLKKNVFSPASRAVRFKPPAEGPRAGSGAQRPQQPVLCAGEQILLVLSCLRNTCLKLKYINFF